MISWPALGQMVRIHYAAKARHARPLHGKVGVVVCVSRPTTGIASSVGRSTKPCKAPRNHGIRIGGQVWFIPAGNLQPVTTP